MEFKGALPLEEDQPGASAVRDRVDNWKFSQAVDAVQVKGITMDQTSWELMLALKDTFGDCGHFDGRMGEIVAAAVWSLTGDDIRL